MKQAHDRARNRGAGTTALPGVATATGQRLILLVLVLVVVSCKGDPAKPGNGRPTLPTPVIYQLPACSPDGEFIAFYKRAEGFGDPSGLAIVQADGTDERFLLSGARGAAWHPSGDRLAVSLSGAIGVYELGNGNVEMLKLVGRENYFPSWSPTGDSLAYWCNGPIDSSGVWLAQIGGAGRVWRLTPTSLVAMMPAWSPMGDLIAFCAHEQSESDYDIWVVGADGTGLRRITNGKRAYRPNWSPDGSRIVYRTSVRPYNYIEVVDLASGRTERLSGAEASGLSEGQSACWKPDGGTIIYNKVCLWSWTDGRNRPLTCDR